VAGGTLTYAYPFPTALTPGVREEAVGTISNTAAGGGNVDWYEFNLPSAAGVTITTPPGQGGGLLTPVLSLYNEASLDNQDLTRNDPYTPTGHRLMARDDGAAHGGAATIRQVLAAGTYWVAVSGTGDTDFSAFLAGSGDAGATGEYSLLITAASLADPPTGPGPAVIATTPTEGARLTRSPLAIYLELSSPIDPSTILPGVNVVLTDVTSGQPVQLQQNANNPVDPTNGVVVNGDYPELVVLPESALAPGDTYQLQIIGDSTGSVPVIAGPDGSPFGASVAAPFGQDFSLTFQVTGIKGASGAANAFNAIGTALPISVAPGSSLTQVSGVIGDDPYVFALTGAASNDVDLYHFTVPGTDGHYAFLAAADTGRIGSPLQVGLALFEDVGGTVTLIAGDIGTGNQTLGTDGSKPLLNDAVLSVGLTPGDYYLAVGAAYNLPDPALGYGTPFVPGSGDGLFDPTVPYSAFAGPAVDGTGAYVLTTSLTRDDTAPHVTGVDGLSTPGAPPTYITVHFDKPVNLRELGYADQSGDAGAIEAVYVRAFNGTTWVDYHPRLLSYDGATNVATFTMLDAVPNGPATFNIAAIAPDGSAGLTDLAGNWLAGSDQGGDLAIPFTVSGPPRVIDPVTNNLTFPAQGLGTSLQHPQVIGPLFPDEMGVDQQGANHAVDLTGSISSGLAGPTVAPSTSYFQIQLLQDRMYGFTMLAAVGVRLEIFTAGGVEITNLASGPVYDFHLTPGTYIVEVGPAEVPADDVAYDLRITLGASFENAVALTVGAAPPYAIALPRATPSAPAAPAPAPPVLSLPAPPGAGSTTATTTIVIPTDAIVTAVSLPSGTLAALSAPPVGGGDRPAGPPAPAAPDRLVLNDLPSPSSDGSVRFALLADGDGPATGPSTGVGLPSGVGSRAAELLRLLERLTIDLLFRGGSVDAWLHRLTVPFAPPESARPGPALDTPGTDQGPPGERRTPAEDEASRPAADWAWAGGLLAAGALAGVPSGAHRRHDSRRKAAHEPTHRRPR
jgi:hypothetical protein